MTVTVEFRLLTLWTEPLKTAAVFLPVLWVLTFLHFMSLISVFAISCLTMLCGSLLYKLYYFVMVKVLAKLPEDTNNHLTEICSWNIEIDEEDVKTYLEAGSTTFNKFALKLKSVLELTNIPESVLFGFNCYFLTLVGSYFNLLTLLTAAWICVFTLPKVYIEKKESVDRYLQVAKDQVSLIKDKIVDKVNSMSVVKEGEKADNVSPVKEE